MTKKGGNVILRRRAARELEPAIHPPEPIPEPTTQPMPQPAPVVEVHIPPPKPKRKKRKKIKKQERPSEHPTHPVLILAAGTEVSWEKKIGSAKQLLALGKDTVLGRIIRQVRERGVEPTLVTHREDFINTAKDVIYYEPASRATIADTLLHTQDLWGGQTVILLGDTVFGNATLNMVLAHRGPLTAFGNSAEIFAFSFRDDDHDHLISTLEKVIADPLCKKGSPWLIYRVYCGKRPDSSHIVKYSFKFSKEATGDIDSLHEYNAMCKIAGGL